MNPQKSHGADVLSRITYADNGGLFELQRNILDIIAAFVEYCLEKKCGRIESIIITGNTTMLHIAAGISPHGIGVYPFTPEFTDLKIIDGNSLGLKAEKVILLPSSDGYIGADIIGGIIACGMHKDDKNSLLVDLGTNGEMVLKLNGSYYAASSAAGPCLEGADISCGCGGIDGAISRFYMSNGKISYDTVNNCAPVGLCGSGLVDLAALLFENGIIDESGYMENDYKIDGCDFSLTTADIRRLQLAKGAIYAAICTLIDEAGGTLDDIEKVYLAGSLGKYMSVKSAVKIGMIPMCFERKIIQSGNLALAGAVLAAEVTESITEMREISKSIKTIALNESKQFTELFMNGMYFG